MNGEEQASILQKNLDKVEERIASSCEKVARKRTEVTLVGVTKLWDSDALLEIEGVAVI